MKNADGLSRKSHLGRGTELLAAAKEVEVPSSIQTTEPSKSEADAENEKKAQTIVPPEPDKEEAALQPDQTQPSTTDEDSEAPVANVPVDVRRLARGVVAHDHDVDLPPRRDACDA